MVYKPWASSSGETIPVDQMEGRKCIGGKDFSLPIFDAFSRNTNSAPIPHRLRDGKRAVNRPLFYTLFSERSSFFLSDESADPKMATIVIVCTQTSSPRDACIRTMESFLLTCTFLEGSSHGSPASGTRWGSSRASWVFRLFIPATLLTSQPQTRRACFQLIACHNHKPIFSASSLSNYRKQITVLWLLRSFIFYKRKVRRESTDGKIFSS